MADSSAPETIAQPESQTAPTSSASFDGFILLVKNPTDRPGGQPFTVRVDASSTVRQLKELLADSYPGSPPVPSQRLIYAGKLLDDRHSMETVMGSCDRSVQHTIHLVVSNLHRPGSSTAGVSTSASAARSATGNPAINPAIPLAQNNLPPANPLLNAGNMFHPYLPTFPQYPLNMYPGMQPIPPQDPSAYQMPYPAQFPSYPPPPSDNTNALRNSNPGAVPPPFAPIDPAAYAAHLQSMERIIADTLAAQQNNAQEAAAAAAVAAAADGADADAQAARAAQAAQVAAQAATQAAVAMHAQAHVQAMANYDAGLRAQMGNNPQAQFPHQAQPHHGAGFGFAIGRGYAAPDGGHHQDHQHQNQEMGEENPRVRQFVFQFEINWSLISKLLFLVYLLGQEGSPRRVYTLMMIALAIYLWQTNRLGFLRRIAGAALPNPTQLFETLFPRENAPNAATAELPSGGAGEAQARPRVTNRFGRAAVILSFIYSFFYGFVCSLLPAWRPEPLPRMEELLDQQANNAEERDVPAPAENQAGDGNNHEHAD